MATLIPTVPLPPPHTFIAPPCDAVCECGHGRSAHDLGLSRSCGVCEAIDVLGFACPGGRPCERFLG